MEEEQFSFDVVLQFNVFIEPCLKPVAMGMLRPSRCGPDE
jgi:hypothetical protein